jgi:TM2 domain-containing membrane protein YozV
MKIDKKFKGLPAVLSFFIPGLGQLYRGQILPFLFFLLVTPIGYTFLFLPGLALHFFSIIHAGASRD